MSDYKAKDAAFISTANSIRSKTGSSSLIQWDENTGFKTAIDSIAVGAGSAISIVDTADSHGGTVRTITGVSLAGDTVTAAHLESGYTAHDAQGNAITGSLVPGSGADYPIFTGVFASGYSPSFSSLTCDKTFAEAVECYETIDYAILETVNNGTSFYYGMNISNDTWPNPTVLYYYMSWKVAVLIITYSSNGNITYEFYPISENDSTDLSASGATVTAPAGYYESNATYTIASGTEGTPTAMKSSANSTMNLYNPALQTSETISPHYWVNGEPYSSTQFDSSYNCTALIPVNSSTTYTVGLVGSTPVIPWNEAAQGGWSFDNNGNYISGSGWSSNTFTTPSNAAYIRFNYYKGGSTVTLDKLNTYCMLVEGSTLPNEYVAYNDVPSHSITVTPSVTNTAGYISGGTHTGTAVTVSASELVSGTKSITANGTGIDVTEYAAVDVAVSTDSAPIFTVTYSDNNMTSITSITCDKTYQEVYDWFYTQERADARVLEVAGSDSWEMGAAIVYANNNIRIFVDDALGIAYLAISYTSSGITWNYPWWEIRDSSDLTVSGATVTVPWGAYYQDASASVASGTVTAPSTISDTGATISTGSGTLTLTKTVSVTPNVTTAGYISSGTAGDSSVSLTASATINPTPTASGATVTIPAGYYTAQTTKSVDSMTLPTSAAASATSGYTSKATISRSASDQYINIPTGYNSAGGYYKVNAVANGSATGPSSLSGSSATVSTGTNTITLTKTGVTTTPTVSAGYVASATTSTATVALTASVTTKAATTYHPSTSDQTIASGTYTTGTQTIKAVTVSGLSADNIKSGVTVKIGDSTDDDCVTSVTGTYSGGSSKAVYMYQGLVSRTANSYGATNAKVTVTKAGTYNISYVAVRGSSSGTMGTNLHIGSTEKGNNTTWNNGTYGQTVSYTNQSISANTTVTIYATSGSNSRAIHVGQLIVEEV